MLFYAGPDQIIPLTGLLGTVFGIALVFWSKIVIFFDKAINSLRRRGKPTQQGSDLQEPAPKD
jgi:hypothetical protein